MLAATSALLGALLVISLPAQKELGNDFKLTGLESNGEIDASAKTAYFHGQSLPVPILIEVVSRKSWNQVLGEESDSKWIEVDLSEQKIRAWDGNNLFLESLVSTGLPGTPTPTGEFRIWTKLRATKMEGGEGKHYYYLPNVPYVMFFQNDWLPGRKGFSLHGTYWHSDFGNRRSHGCVNLPTPIAEQLYYWVSPVLPEGKKSIAAASDNPGTRIVIHE